MHRKQLLMLGILTMVTVLASVIVILTEFGSMMVSVQAQVNASSLTPAQKDAICNPNNPASRLNPVNTTESRICGIPVTVKPHPSNATAPSSPNIATGGEAPPTSSPSPSPPSPSPSSPSSTSIAPEAAPPSE
jgi:cell division protein FtsN